MTDKKISSIEDLPQWFNLENYNQVLNFTPSQWHEQMLVRATYLFWLRVGHEVYDIGIDQWIEMIRSARKNPIINVKKSSDNSDLFLGSIFKIKNKEKLQSVLGVSPSTFGQIISAHKALPKDALTAIEKLYSELEETHKILDTLYSQKNRGLGKNVDSMLLKTRSTIQDIEERISQIRSEQFSGFSDRGIEVARIDLMLPDKILINQFEVYLKKIRRSSKFKNRKYIKPDYKKWTEYSVLPYMDLLIWSLEEKTPISHQVYIDALFPDGDRDIDVIRKTLDPLIKRLITRASDDAHTAIVAGELWSKQG